LITENQKLFVSYLIVNPKNREVGTTYFWDGKNSCCILGMVCECFNIPVLEYGNFDNYEAVIQVLDLSDDELHAMWKLSDRYFLSFSESAKILEDYWTGQIGDISP
jgi:hypothetical protein